MVTMSRNCVINGERRKKIPLGMVYISCTLAFAFVATYSRYVSQDQVILEAQYGPAGGFSATHSTYPVPQSALADYLEHQPKQALNMLIKRSKSDVFHPTQQVPQMNQEKSLDAQPAVQKALSEYLGHEKSYTHQLQRQINLGKLHVASLKSRSKVQQLALAILGHAGSQASDIVAHTDITRHHSDAVLKTEMPKKSEKGQEKIMKIISLLQKEISLDTTAINAFRHKLQKVGLDNEVKKLQKNNEHISKQVSKVMKSVGVKSDTK